MLLIVNKTTNFLFLNLTSPELSAFITRQFSALRCRHSCFTSNIHHKLLGVIYPLNNHVYSFTIITTLVQTCWCKKYYLQLHLSNFPLLLSYLCQFIKWKGKYNKALFMLILKCLDLRSMHMLSRNNLCSFTIY